MRLTLQTYHLQDIILSAGNGILEMVEAALVKIQAKEIDALKMEINLLRRKGGHVYAYSASHNVTGVP